MLANFFPTENIFFCDFRFSVPRKILGSTTNSRLCYREALTLSRLTFLSSLRFQGFRNGVSQSMIYSRDTPFWLGTLKYIITVSDMAKTGEAFWWVKTRTVDLKTTHCSCLLFFASDQLDWNGQSSAEQSAMARGRRWPMLHRERWA